VAPFQFNAMFLRDKNVPESCGVIVHKATETKEVGMALTKSLMMQFDGAAAAGNVTIDAETWQIDYSARLRGMDEDLRLVNLDTYGHTAFVDGFSVTRHDVDANKYLIAPGVVYIGGLRVALNDTLVQTVTDKPKTLYIDAYRDGTALSDWENLFNIVASNDELTDYTNANGRHHYVAKLARINSDGSIDDLRQRGGLQAHLDAGHPHKQYAKKTELSSLTSQSQFLPYDPERKYRTGEVCYTVKNGELSYWQWYSNVESLAGKSPLLDENRHTGWTDNTKPFYWVPYTGDQVGQPFFWLDTAAPEWAVMEINVDLPIAVYWRLARRYPHLVTGETINTGEIRGEFLRVLDQGRGADADRGISEYQT
ncbi:phage tail protein, partial [Salinivibrio sp. VYel6]|uniref:phage tail protein n=1 Tax=Salinivibrio sp. VYel6 TaxID=2490493 RepID=UPI00352A11E3